MSRYLTTRLLLLVLATKKVDALYQHPCDWVVSEFQDSLASFGYFNTAMTFLWDACRFSEFLRGSKDSCDSCHGCLECLEMSPQDQNVKQIKEKKQKWERERERERGGGVRRLKGEKTSTSSAEMSPSTLAPIDDDGNIHHRRDTLYANTRMQIVVIYKNLFNCENTKAASQKHRKKKERTSIRIW